LSIHAGKFIFIVMSGLTKDQKYFKHILNGFENGLKEKRKKQKKRKRKSSPSVFWPEGLASSPSAHSFSLPRPRAQPSAPHSPQLGSDSPRARPVSLPYGPSRAGGAPSPPFPSLTARVRMAATASSPTSVRFESDGVQGNRPRPILISQGFDLPESFLSTMEPTATSFSIYCIGEASLTLVWRVLDPAEPVPKPPP